MKLMGNGKYSYLSKNVLLFALNGFLPKVLVFVLIPIYTSYLTTAEYGISDLISTTVQLLVPILTLDIQDAVMRYAMDKTIDNKQVLTFALRIIFVGTAILSLVSGIVAVFKIGGLNAEYLLFLCITYFTVAINNSVTMFLKTIEKINVIVISSVLNSVITLTANILFLTVFKWGLTGYLTAQTIGALVSVIICFFGAKLYKYITKSVSKQLKKEMLKFSFPLIFSVIAWWVNSASDRYVLTLIVGVSASGIYAVANKLPSLLSIFQSVFYQAWSISAIKEFDREDKDNFISNMYNLMNFGMIIFCSLLIICTIPLAKLLFSNDFFEAYKFVPPLLVSVIFNALSLFIGSIFTAVKDTKTLSISTIIGAVVNTVCNFILIYFLGIYGAAIATLVGYFVTYVMRHIILKKYIRLKIKWTRDIFAYVLLLVQMLLNWWGLQLILVQAVLLVVLICLYIKEIKNFFKNIKNKITNKNKEIEKGNADVNE